MKVKMLREYRAWKLGDICEVPFGVATEIIKRGYARAVVEPEDDIESKELTEPPLDKALSPKDAKRKAKKKTP